jgi:hypothetical protein
MSVVIISTITFVLSTMPQLTDTIGQYSRGPLNPIFYSPCGWRTMHWFWKIIPHLWWKILFCTHTKNIKFCDFWYSSAIYICVRFNIGSHYQSGQHSSVSPKSQNQRTLPRNLNAAVLMSKIKKLTFKVSLELLYIFEIWYREYIVFLTCSMFLYESQMNC